MWGSGETWWMQKASVRALLDAALAPVDDVCAEAHRCPDQDDLLCVHLHDIAAAVERLRSLTDEVDIIEALGDSAPEKLPTFRVGTKGSYKKWGFASRDDIKDLHARVRAAGDRLTAVRADVAQECAERIGSVIRRFTLEAAAERRRAGRLEFHDLLVLARYLVTQSPSAPQVRARLHGRYTHLLLDEFQDTDPIQIDLAVRIAAADPLDPAAGEGDWADVEVSPGHLFFVGDPKQSIYRFRRADIATFLEAQARFGGEGLVELTANFRTTRPVIDWVNHVFGALFAEPADVDTLVPSQPGYVPLAATRGKATVGAAVSVVGRAPHPAGTSADDVRAREAADVAATIRRVIAEGWSVGEGADAQGDDQWRAARLGDVTILVPSRTSLPFLEDALDEAGIPYRAESSSLVYATRAVRDLLMVARAVDDPTNTLHVVSALRTPLFGCGDDDLLRFRVERNGSWSYFATQPETVPEDDPVADALRYLRRCHDEKRWLAPSELLDRVARDRRAFELGFAEGRPRDVWRRLRFVIDQARAWSEATGGNLRQYLAWVDQQAANNGRVAEAVLPETDDDAVRIMTIHAAKGLEFPVTIVSGMSTRPGGRSAPAEVVFPPTGGVGYRFGRHVSTQEYEEWKPIDEQMGFHERIRLLYVAATRARDHLVVSLHRVERASQATSRSRTNAELLVDGIGELLPTLSEAVDHDAPPAPAPPVALASPPPPFEAWQAELRDSLQRAAQVRAIAATALSDEGGLDADPDPGLQKRPRDLDLPPWAKGRYGTAIGRAVHGVLQTVPLAGADADEVAAAVAGQCESEAIPTQAPTVRALVTAALGSRLVREAAGRRFWREVYIGTEIGGRVLEGYVDLLYRSDDGLVVVDYKTASTSDRGALAERAAGYRFQGAAYALAVSRTTGEPVTEVVFLFLTPDGAIEVRLDDLAAAVADVRAAMEREGEPVLVDE